jgi:hypothetical protein
MIKYTITQPKNEVHGTYDSINVNLDFELNEKCKICNKKLDTLVTNQTENAEIKIFSTIQLATKCKFFQMNK